MNYRSYKNSTTTLLGLIIIALSQSPTVYVQAFAHNEVDSTPYCKNVLDVAALKERLQSGRVYQHLSFLSEDEVELLWTEINHLEKDGAFARSGLSNTVQGSKQQFGLKDRTLCPAPWWSESLVGKAAVSPTGKDVQPIASRIQDLRSSLAIFLDRPSMADDSLAHECYYSMSQVGSFLPRHMDERHEELKGSKGWLLPSRRSLSWLIYLSDPEDWSLEEHGGALRTFPPKTVVDPKVGGNMTHDEGNLQIGWLLGDNDSQARPVYLDSWLPISAAPGQPPDSHCILYTRDQERSQIFLTQPWLSEGIQGISMADFIQTWARRQSSDTEDSGLFLRQEDAKQFTLIEDRPSWDEGDLPEGTVAEDIKPTRGSLVVFDSVTMPHQVELIKNGRRVALAGWFHEATQPFPEGLYS